MNVRTALISSALLLAVLGWACEQQGPASPSALATPGGGSLGAAGGVSLDAAGGAILGVKAPCPPPEGTEPHPSCKDKDSDGGKFVAAITRGDKGGDNGYDPSKTVISAGPPFPVDNKCNSRVVRMEPITASDGTDLTHLKLRVNKCKSNFHVSVKVWVGDGGGNRFATVYLPGNPSFLPDGVTLHVHAGKERIAEFFRLDDTTGTPAFTLNIADIEYTLAR